MMHGTTSLKFTIDKKMPVPQNEVKTWLIPGPSNTMSVTEQTDFAVGMQQQDLGHQLKFAKWYSIHFKGHTWYVDPCLLISDPVITYWS